MIWKGAISFGLVNVPVGLYPASQDSGVDFDWLDKRSMDPVGYKRINKRTGKDIDRADIVKGIKQDNGEYVVLSEDEIKAACPKTTQTIEIEAFVNKDAVPFVYLDRPYYLEPLGKSEKVYALLREAMLAADVIGIARVVMHTKEHLAALIPSGPALILNTMRWAGDVRDVEDLKLPAAGKSAANLKDAELKMAEQLVAGMTVEWDPSHYGDEFTAAIHKLVEQRVNAGKTEQVAPLEEAGPATSSNVIDLTELLRRSLGQRKDAKGPEAEDKARTKGTDAANDEAEDAEAERPLVTKKSTSKKAASKKAPTKRAAVTSSERGASARKNAPRKAA